MKKKDLKCCGNCFFCRVDNKCTFILDKPKKTDSWLICENWSPDHGCRIERLTNYQDMEDYK